MAVYEIKPQNNAGGQGGTNLYSISVYGYNESSYPARVTLQVEEPDLETYEDLVNYLKDKGFVYVSEEYMPIALSCTGYDGENHTPYSGIYVGTFTYDEQEVEGLRLVKSRDDGYIVDDENFSITYLGEQETENTEEIPSIPAEPVPHP